MMLGAATVDRGAVALVVTLAVTALIAVFGAGSAQAAFGDGFGVSDKAGGTAFPSQKGFWAGTCDLGTPSVEDGGFASTPADVPVDPPAHCIDTGVGCFVCFGGALWEPGESPAWRLAPVAQAGAHPDGTVALFFHSYPVLLQDPPMTRMPDGEPRDIMIGVPAGVVGDPTAVPKCPAGALEFVPAACPPETQVGVLTAMVGTYESVYPIWNVEARDGVAAEFMVSPGTSHPLASIPVTARPRTEGDFGIDTLVTRIPGGLPVLGQVATLWGVPWSDAHDRYRPPLGYSGDVGRGGMPLSGLPEGQRQSYDPSWGPIKPFFTNPTECSGELLMTTGEFRSWQNPDVTVSDQTPADVPVSGCADVSFEPTMSVAPTTAAADGPSGLDVELRLPQNDEPPAAVAADPDDATGAPAHWRSPAGRAVAQLDRTDITLPLGVSINPAAAAGLAGCSDPQIGLVADGSPPRFNNEDPFDGRGAECPAGSKIGAVDVETPLLEETLTGDVVLGMPRPGDVGRSTDRLRTRLFIVVRNRKRGLVAKIFGTGVADPATGQLAATFDKNPRLPLEKVTVRIKGGQRGMLATQPRCGSQGWSSTLTPWTAAHGAGGAAVPAGGAFAMSANCAYGFAPAFQAGMDARQAGGSGTFSLRMTRQDGEQRLAGVSVKLPRGLLAAVGDVPLCTSAQAAAGSCPAASRIGMADAGAGAGLPFFLERKGDVFLTQSYKGAPFGLLVKVPVEAGPFRGEYALDDVIVRQALHVDPVSAQATAVSDPFPQIWHGIPLRVREITVKVDRPEFIRNPSGCGAKSIVASIASIEGRIAERRVPFRATECARLGFRPRLSLRLLGRRQMRTGRHPSIHARVTQRRGEAGIRRARVRLPGTLALDPDNAQALCEFEDGTKPDLEEHCPRGSIVGRARAVSPLLRDPLAGNVYFVKNIRIDKKTGNEIRTLPMIVVALRGEVAINLKGRSSTTRNGMLVNTFGGVPDAPISRFDMRIRGGRNGILAVTRTRRSSIDICRRRAPHNAVSLLNAHNGRKFDRKIRVATPCRRKGGRGHRAVARSR